MKDKQIASLSVLAEEFENSQSEHEACEENEERNTWFSQKNLIEKKIREFQDQILILENNNQALENKRVRSENEADLLRAKNLEFMENLEMAAKHKIQLEKEIQMMREQGEALNAQVGFREKEVFNVRKKMEFVSEESAKLKEKLVCCEEYIRELEKNVGMQNDTSMILI